MMLKSKFLKALFFVVSELLYPSRAKLRKILINAVLLNRSTFNKIFDRFLELQLNSSKTLNSSAIKLEILILINFGQSLLIFLHSTNNYCTTKKTSPQKQYWMHINDIRDFLYSDKRAYFLLRQWYTFILKNNKFINNFQF